MLAIAEGYDTLYREGLDGFIGIKSTPGERLEMITMIDMSTLWSAKLDDARE
jgi:hypothetical protein